MARQPTEPKPEKNGENDYRIVSAGLVEAVEALLEWDKRRDYIVPYLYRDPLRRALSRTRQQTVEGESVDD